MNGATEEIDLYEVLGISKTASKSEIKKAYHKAALSSHPDKVPEPDRASAEIRFKSVSRAYEILHDEQTRQLYDDHGMSAFDTGPGAAGPGGMGADIDLEDILNMFGMGGGLGGMGGMGGMGGSRRPRKGRNEEKQYEVTLEELYKGKTTKFASTKNVVCSSCKGSGGKDKAKPKQCGVCGGKGMTTGLRSVGPGLVTQETAVCNSCNGTGTTFKDKDKCRKCKGSRVVESRKVLELYIPPGSREGEKIVLKGEGDQLPDQEPGDIIFELVEVPHTTFRRAGADLAADVHITLAEALTGFNRVVLTHLDGRGIQINVRQPKGRVLRPDQVLKVAGEGMPIKRSESKGDLYLIVKIQFPATGWIEDEAALQRVREVLPKTTIPPVPAEVVEEVEYDETASMDEFGAGSNDPQGGAEWEDEDEEDGQPQCAQQ